MWRIIKRVRPILQRKLPSALYAGLRWVWLRWWLTPSRVIYRLALRSGRTFDVAPPVHIVAQYGQVDPARYMEIGRTKAARIHEHLRRAGAEMAAGARVLDFGCGAGRVMHAFNGRFELFGCDIKAEPVEWIRANRPHWTVVTNKVTPPLPPSFDNFDLIYALSVFTHMDENATEVWLEHLHERLRRGGVFFLTTIDPRDELVGKFGYDPNKLECHFLYDKGKNVTFISEEYIRSRWLDRFELRYYGALADSRQRALILTKK